MQAVRFYILRSLVVFVLLIRRRPTVNGNYEYTFMRLHMKAAHFRYTVYA